MKAHISYNPLLQAIELKIENYELQCRVYDIIDITKITAYKDGFLTLEVQRPVNWYKRMQPHLHMLEGCVNEEYVDFIEAMEHSLFSEKFITSFTALLNKLEFKDIILEIPKYDMEEL